MELRSQTKAQNDEFNQNNQVVTPPPSTSKHFGAGRLLPAFHNSDSEDDSADYRQQIVHARQQYPPLGPTYQHSLPPLDSLDSFPPTSRDLPADRIRPTPQDNLAPTPTDDGTNDQQQHNELPPTNNMAQHINIPSTLLPSPFNRTQKEDIDIFLAGFDLYSDLQQWDANQKARTIPLLFKNDALLWYTSLDEEIKEDFDRLKEALLTRFKPHESLKWVRLREFQMKRQQPLESVENYFQEMRRLGTSLNKTLQDITDTTVGGLLPSISRFIMVRSPQTWDEALDLARKASILEDPKEGKIEVALATLTNKFEDLNSKLGRIEEGSGRRIPRQNPGFFNPGQPYRGNNTNRQTDRFPRQTNRPFNNNFNGSRQSNPFRRNTNACRACGDTSHQRDTCRFKQAQCRVCLKVGHIGRICRHRQSQQ